MMKRVLAIVLGLCLLSGLSVNADIDTIEGSTIAGGGAEFCSGSELFCEDFEGVDTTWDSTNGTYDDDDPNSQVGDECVSFSTAGAYVREAFSGASGEFNTEFWFYSADDTNNYTLMWGNSDFSNNILILKIHSDSDIYILYRNEAGTVDTNIAYTATNWVKIGIYYKEETGSDDGVISVWISSDDGVFEADEYQTFTDLNTNMTDAEAIHIGFDPGTAPTRVDNIKIVSGAPSWPTS
jgi:hypothetical protein